MEVIGYVTKPLEFKSVEDEVEYLTVLKGARLIQLFRSLNGNTLKIRGLSAIDGEVAPCWWNYIGLIDGSCENTEPRSRARMVIGCRQRKGGVRLMFKPIRSEVSVMPDTDIDEVFRSNWTGICRKRE